MKQSRTILRAVASIIFVLAGMVGAIAQIGPGSPGISINTTPVIGGSSGNCLYVNGNVVGQQSCGGAPSGAAGGALKGTYPNPGLADINSIATSLAIGGATIGSNALAVTGAVNISGNTVLGSTASLGWSTDLFLSRDAANALGQRNGANAQVLSIYNTYTDASNYERGVFDWTATANTLTIGTQNAGTGSARTINFSIGGTTRASLSSSTFSSTTSFKSANNASISAGGATGIGYTFSTTANFGVFFGSGVPTLSAAKGSLYLRSDGSGVADRMYINTNGSTTWTNVVTGG